jgi:serine/threonine protein kinase
LHKKQAIVNQQYEIEFLVIPERVDFEDLFDVINQYLRRDPKQRPRIEELLHHRYLTFESITYGLVESQLLSFLPMIQDDHNDFDFEKSSFYEALEIIGEEFRNGAAIVFPEIGSRDIIPRLSRERSDVNWS